MIVVAFQMACSSLVESDNYKLIGWEMEIEKIVLLTNKGSQRKLERITGFSQSIISDWERGHHNPSLHKLNEYVKILNIRLLDFLRNRTYVDKVKNITYEIPNKLKQRRLTLEKAYVLGVVRPGDGCVGYKIIRLNSIDYDFIKEFCKNVKKAYGLYPHVYFERRDNRYCAIVCSRKVVEDIKSFNVSFREENWEVQIEILTSDRKIKALYLNGVFDSQGNAHFNKYRNVNLRSYNTKGLQQIQQLLFSLKIGSHFSDKGRRLFIYGKNIERFHQFIRFSIRRRQLVLEKALTSYKTRKTSPYVVDMVTSEMKKLRQIGLSYSKIAHIINNNQNTSISPSTIQNRLKE